MHEDAQQEVTQMNSPDPVIVATDLSSHAEWAARRGALIAAGQRSALELLHVLDGSPREGRGEVPELPAVDATWNALANESGHELNALAETLRSTFGVEAHTTLRRGVPLQEIMAAAKGRQLLVLGTAGRHPWRDMFIGSTADRLLRKAPCPMLVVKKSPLKPYRRVLLPVDLENSDAADLRVQFAAASSFAPGAECRVCHAAIFPFEGKMALSGVAPDEIKSYRESVLARSRSRLDALVSSVARADQRFVPQVFAGDPASLVSDEASAMGADLIVMFKQSGSLLEDWFLGSVTRHALFHSDCDVLVLPRRAPPK